MIPDDILSDPGPLVNFLSAKKCTRVFLTPSLSMAILNDPSIDLPRRLGRLEYWFTTGEICQLTMAFALPKKLPNICYINEYRLEIQY